MENLTPKESGKENTMSSGYFGDRPYYKIIMKHTGEEVILKGVHFGETFIEGSTLNMVEQEIMIPHTSIHKILKGDKKKG